MSFAVFASPLLVHTAGMGHAEILRSASKRFPFFCRSTVRAAAQIALLLTVAMVWPAASQEKPAQKRWETGAYSFSDELGGFRIVGVSGTGTKSDPIVIAEEMESATPVTMVIRTIRPIRPFDRSGLYANGFLHMRVEVTNNSKLPWIEFEFELQEQLHKPSTFGDGLSFDQRRVDGGNISSANFLEYSRDFEPHDRLRFTQGKVDHLENAGFGFMITDFTPRWEFYLAQDPRIPSS
jgi:hypothetical protein